MENKSTYHASHLLQRRNDDVIEDRGQKFVTYSKTLEGINNLEMWANAQRDGRPVEHRWRPLFNAAKFG